MGMGADEEPADSVPPEPVSGRLLPDESASEASSNCQYAHSPSAELSEMASGHIGN